MTIPPTKATCSLRCHKIKAKLLLRRNVGSFACGVLTANPGCFWNQTFISAQYTVAECDYFFLITPLFLSGFFYSAALFYSFLFAFARWIFKTHGFSFCNPPQCSKHKPMNGFLAVGGGDPMTPSLHDSPRSSPAPTRAFKVWGIRGGGDF